MITRVLGGILAGSFAAAAAATAMGWITVDWHPGSDLPAIRLRDSQSVAATVNPAGSSDETLHVSGAIAALDDTGATSKDSVKASLADVDAALNALQTTCTSDQPPIIPVGDPRAGLWGNPYRWGTGWTFAYDDHRHTMMVVWHTFYPAVNGGQTWLISKWAAVEPDPSTGGRKWHADLYRTSFNEPSGHPVGTLAMAFPQDSATHGSVVWNWNLDNGLSQAVSGTECIYAFDQDAPAPSHLGPSLATPTESSPTLPNDLSSNPPPSGPFYGAIWSDPSTPGLTLEVNEIDNANTEVTSVSTYDLTGAPVWLWAQIGPLASWPPSTWTQVSLGYRKALYNMATDNCSSSGCTNETMYYTPSFYYGREYHWSYDAGGNVTGANDAVVGLRVTAPAANVDWPRSDLPPSPPNSDLSGCTYGNIICRPVKRLTDTTSITVNPAVCSTPTPASTCDTTVNWYASPLGKVIRVDPITSNPISHNGDNGNVGSNTFGQYVDHLSADEKVRYKLIVGGDLAAYADARAAFSWITAPGQCIISPPLGGCDAVVSWGTSGPDSTVHVERVEQPIGGGTQSRTTIPASNGVTNGSLHNTVFTGTQVYYELFRGPVWLAGTSNNPTTPVAASITAAPNLCSVPLNDTVCSTNVTWAASSPASAQVYRVNLCGDPDCGPWVGPLNSPGVSSVTDYLPRDSHVEYVVVVNNQVEATSIDVSAIASKLLVNGQVIDQPAQCVVPAGSSVCNPAVHISWSSTPAAAVYENLYHGTNPVVRTQRGSGFTGDYYNSALALGDRVQYDVMIGGVLHAQTPMITAASDNEGGDSNDGTAQQPVPPVAFVEPALDTDSDQVGAIAGDFRVDEGGNATYRIPLAMPPGAGGLTPVLALNYNSGIGEGIAGTGFNIDGLSALTACRPSVEAGDTAVPSDDPNKLCLDGQRLLLVAGNEMQVGAEYRTEVDSFQRVLITGNELVGFGGVLRTALIFKVQGKDGSTRTFGGAAGTLFGTVSNLAGGVRPQAWYQTQLIDASSNTVTFAYSNSLTPDERQLSTVTYSGGSAVFHYVDSTRQDVAYSKIGRHTQSRLLSSIEIKGPSGAMLRYYEAAYNTGVSTWDRYRPHLLSLKECSAQSGTCYPATTFGWSDATTQIDQTQGSIGTGLGYFELGDVDGDKRTDLWWTSDASQGGSNNRLHISSFAGDVGGVSMRDIYAADFLLPDGFNNGGLWEVVDINGDGRDDLIYAWAHTSNGGLGSINQLTWFRRVSVGKQLGPEEELFTVAVNSQQAAANSATLAARLGPAPTSPLNPQSLQLLGSSMIADVDGDGLPDLVFRAPDGQFWVAQLQRATSGTSPYQYHPIKAVFLNQDDSSADNRCGFGTSSLLRKEENFSQATDFNGDGRADLRFLIDARSNYCPENDFRLDVFYSEGVRASDGQFVFRFNQPFGATFTMAPGGIDGIAEAAERFRTVDVNADGLTDLIYEDGNDVWRFKLGGPVSNDTCASNCGLVGQGRYVQLIDFDGDGKLDFWMRDGNVYQILIWTGNNWAPQGVVTPYGIPTGDDWHRIPGDFDGDGATDNFYVATSTGHWTMQRPITHHKPRGVITSITNGLGATTTIDYAPLTFPTAYRPDYDGPYTVSGRGSPVADVNAPTYAARKVHSSAPVVNGASAESVVSYKYAGLKIQGGGRGSLGFRRISTTTQSSDPAHWIEVDSHYIQRFPYTGLAEFTETRLLDGLPADVCAANPDAVGCMVYTMPCSTDLHAVCDDDLPQIADSSTTIKETSDQWRLRVAATIGAAQPGCVAVGTGITVPDPALPSCPVGQPASEGELDRRVLTTSQSPVFVAHVETLTSDYELDDGASAAAIRTEATVFPIATYDAYGNPQHATATVSSDSDVDLVTITTDSYFNYTNNTASPTWQLARLNWAKVKTTRVANAETSSNIRMSSFTYDANGRLASEKVEGKSSATFPDNLLPASDTPAVAKYYAYNSNGNRTKTSVCNAETAESSCRALSVSSGIFDLHPALGDITRYSMTAYDSLQRLPETTTEVFSNSAGEGREVVSSQVVARTEAGDPTEIRDINGVVKKIRYGALGRQRFTWIANGASSQYSARYCTGLPVAAGLPTTTCPANLGLAYRSTVADASAPPSYVYYDVLGRPTVTVKQGYDLSAITWISIITQYDANGNVARQSDPFFARDSAANAAVPVVGATIKWLTSSYDALKRPVDVSHSGDNVHKRFAYHGLRTTTTLPANISGLQQTRVDVRDGVGNIVRTIDANGLEVATTYDAAGNATKIKRAGSTTTQITYDALGRKRTMSDPDANGTWTFKVNGAGEVIQQTTPRGTCTSSYWDSRGRLWQRIDYTNSSCTIPESTSLWSFDVAANGVGQVFAENNAAVSHTYAYDSLGRKASMTTVQDSKSYVDQWTYDPLGRPFQHFFTPPGLPTTGEQYQYTIHGNLWMIFSAYSHNGNPIIYREIEDVDSRGHVTQESTSAPTHYDLTRTYSDVTGRLTRLLATSSTSVLQDQSWDYDDVGNVKVRSSRDATSAVSETFTYDNLQRLLTENVMTGGQITFARSQSYDPQGNIATKNDVGTYTYGGTTSCGTYSGPHAVRTVNGISICYDANGNVVKESRGSAQKTFTYSAADQVVDVTDGMNNFARVGFKYGPGRERVGRLDYTSTGGTASTVVHEVSGAQARWTANASNGANTLQEVRRYVGNIVVVQTGTGSNYRIKREVLLTDYQGSTAQVLGATSLQPVNAATPGSYDAWGQRRDGTTWGSAIPWTNSLEDMLHATTTHGYTGHEMAETVGVIHMGGRIYEPAIGRFLQLDPVVQDTGNSQDWNPYSYAFNNPLAYTDPTGLWGASEQAWLRTIAAIAISVYSGGTAAGAAWGLFGESVTTAEAWGAVVVGGFAAGAVQTGTLRGAVVGAVSAAVFHGIGQGFLESNSPGLYDDAGDMSFSGYAAKALVHGAAGGVMAQLQGDRFGHGFVSAGVGEALSPAIERVDSVPLQAIAVSVAGGTGSVLSGGKFANGAVTAAFGFAFNRLADSFANSNVPTVSISAQNPQGGFASPSLAVLAQDRAYEAQYQATKGGDELWGWIGEKNVNGQMEYFFSDMIPVHAPFDGKIIPMGSKGMTVYWLNHTHAPDPYFNQERFSERDSSQVSAKDGKPFAVRTPMGDVRLLTPQNNTNVRVRAGTSLCASAAPCLPPWTGH